MVPSQKIDQEPCTSIPIVHDDVQTVKPLLGCHAGHRLRLVSDTKRFHHIVVSVRTLHCFESFVSQLLQTSRICGLYLLPREAHQIIECLAVGFVLQLIHACKYTLRNKYQTNTWYQEEETLSNQNQKSP